ncbi:MAG: rRNA pseudouridine synthase [Krumholzibacteria bacterium]|nr:rRNA pseudouridine synthase [Candidatus Krumholzibacteria bacterium]
MHEPDGAMRLNRFLARAGLGSRRAVEDLVRAGRVAVGGETVTDLGRRVDPRRDPVSVDGRPVTLPDDLRVYAFHKPLDVVSTLRSQGGQPSLLPYRLSADLPERFVPIGRLDADSTGLLLWTDDGELNQALCRPSSGIWKSYEVTLDKGLPLARLPELTDGRIVLDGRPVRPCRLEPGRDTRRWTMELHEGRKRQIRRMFKTVGLRVTGLHRVAVGPVRLGKLRPGDFRRLTPPEVQALRDVLDRR